MCLFVLQLNSKITEYYRFVGLDEQSEDLVGVIKICEPFSGAPNFSYMPESCPKDAITVADLPLVSKSKLKLLLFRHKMFSIGKIIQKSYLWAFGCKIMCRFLLGSRVTNTTPAGNAKAMESFFRRHLTTWSRLIVVVSKIC